MASERDNSRFDHGVATLQEPRHRGETRREQRLRRGGVLIMTVVVVAALLGVFGGRHGTVTATTDSVRLSVQYPQVTRPGIEAPVQIHVTRVGGIEEPVRVAIDAHLFEKLDFQAWYPTPSSETADDRLVIYEFDPPPTGDTLVVLLDAHAQSTQSASADTYTVTLPDDHVGVDFRIWVMP